jgi:ATP dependent DNA ligase domain
MMVRCNGVGVRLSRETGTTGRTVIRLFEKQHVLCERAHFFLMAKRSIATRMASSISTRFATERMIGPSFLYAFDLIKLDGRDLRREPIETRKTALVKLMRKSDYGIFLNEHVEDEAATVFRHACKLGLEGIVSKRPGSLYVSGRSPPWLS